MVTMMTAGHDGDGDDDGADDGRDDDEPDNEDDDDDQRRQKRFVSFPIMICAKKQYRHQNLKAQWS